MLNFINLQFIKYNTDFLKYYYNVFVLVNKMAFTFKLFLIKTTRIYFICIFLSTRIIYFFNFDS